MQTTLHAPDIQCDGCANSIKTVLGRIEGIGLVDVDVTEKNVTVTHDESKATRAQIEAALDRAGFPVTA